MEMKSAVSLVVLVTLMVVATKPQLTMGVEPAVHHQFPDPLLSSIMLEEIIHSNALTCHNKDDSCVPYVDGCCSPYHCTPVPEFSGFPPSISYSFKCISLPFVSRT
ncbi:hypothetical protein SOVF_191020 [Spinacia oleracea]|nr:hypothetical protein SOVF_191020 [Spinacia oleracea]